MMSFFQHSNQNGKKELLLRIILIVVIVIFLVFLFLREDIVVLMTAQKGKIVEDRIVIPHTTAVSPMDARGANKSGYQTPLAPRNDAEKIIISQTTSTLRESIDLASREAKRWAEDVRPSFVKSLGTVTLSGQSTGWDILFYSEKKKQGFEVVVSLGKIALARTIPTSEKGGNLPSSWRDIKDVLGGYATHPLYRGATMSGVVFYFNADNQKWYYSITTSKGISSVDAEQ